MEVNCMQIVCTQTMSLKMNCMNEAENIKMMVDRKSNSKRKDEAYIAFLKTHMRKKIESVFSELERYLPNHIHAVTAKGLMIKVFIFLFAFTPEKIRAT